MVFAKLWLLGLLVAVLFVAATPPTSPSIVVKSEQPGQQQEVVPVVTQPCPDTATAQVAAAEERLSAVVERNRQELRTEITQTAASASEMSERLAKVEEGLADIDERLSRIEEQLRNTTSDADDRLSQIEERLGSAEVEGSARNADMKSIRAAMAAPHAMTWALTGLGAVGAAGAAYSVWRARRRRARGIGSEPRP